MLSLALEGQLPLVKITTSDTVNVEEVLNAYLLKGRFKRIPDFDVIDEWIGQGGYLYIASPPEDSFSPEEVYRECVEHETTLVVVNPTDESPAYFNAGELTLPPSMLRSFLEDLTDEVEPLAIALGGLSLKEVSEICGLANARGDGLTPSAIMRIRQMVTGARPGLQQVDTTSDQYRADTRLLEWLDKDGRFFSRDDVPDAIVPRGILLSGPPGVGKTSGAKFVARRLGVPLFRLNLSSALGKYHGQSEGNVLAALARVDMAEPCVLLIDEVEKVLSMDDESGVVRRILADLLWWLQERRSRVLAVLTTNDFNAIPPELIRKERITTHIGLGAIQNDNEAREFCKSVWNWLRGQVKPSSRLPKYGDIETRIIAQIGGVPPWTHAQLKDSMLELARRLL